MKKILLFILTLVVIQSCEKSSSTNSGNLFLEITVDGQTYKENLVDIAGTGFSGQTSCTNKPGFLQFSGMIETSQVEFVTNLFHHENDVDFANPSSAGARLVDIQDFSGSLNGACNSNFDLNIYFVDKSLGNQACTLQSAGRTHTIESITLTETTSTEKIYAVSGNFSCTLRNSNNVAIPLSGKYRVAVRTLR